MALGDLDVIDVLVNKDGHFKFNKHHLDLLVNQSRNCSKCSVISIIGDTKCGKSTIMNMLIDYYESANRDKWPGDTTLTNHYFDTDYSSEVPVKLVQIYANTIQVFDHDDNNNNDNRVTVYLLDTQHIFDFSRPDQTMYDIITFLFHVSSTVLFVSMKSIKDEIIENLIANIRDLDRQTIDKKLFHLVLESPNQSSPNKSTTIKYHLPISSIDPHKRNIKYNTLNANYIRKLRNLFKYTFDEIDELQCLRENGDFIRPDQIVSFFSHCVRLSNITDDSQDVNIEQLLPPYPTATHPTIDEEQPLPPPPTTIPPVPEDCEDFQQPPPPPPPPLPSLTTQDSESSTQNPLPFERFIDSQQVNPSSHPIQAHNNIMNEQTQSENNSPKDIQDNQQDKFKTKSNKTPISFEEELASKVKSRTERQNTQNENVIKPNRPEPPPKPQDLSSLIAKVITNRRINTREDDEENYNGHNSDDNNIENDWTD